MASVTDTKTLDGPVLVRRYNTLIAGTVSVEGSPARRRPRVYSRQSGSLVAEASSNEDGAFEFKGLRPGRYVVQALDPNREFNAVVVDNVQPVPINSAE